MCGPGSRHARRVQQRPACAVDLGPSLRLYVGPRAGRPLLPCCPLASFVPRARPRVPLSLPHAPCPHIPVAWTHSAPRYAMHDHLSLVRARCICEMPDCAPVKWSPLGPWAVGDAHHETWLDGKKRTLFELVQLAAHPTGRRGSRTITLRLPPPSAAANSLAGDMTAV